MPNWLLYGATGYTGELIAREAVRRGERPILAGRNAEAVGRLGAELSCPVRIASLDDPVALAKMLAEVDVLLNLAAPLPKRAGPIDACLAAHVHYLDITGELDVIELAAGGAAHAAAGAGITLMPAVRFDVVPSDCLAAMLKERLPGCRAPGAGFHPGRPAQPWHGQNRAGRPAPRRPGPRRRPGSSRCRWASRRWKSPFAIAPGGR